MRACVKEERGRLVPSPDASGCSRQPGNNHVEVSIDVASVRATVVVLPRADPVCLRRRRPTLARRVPFRLPLFLGQSLRSFPRSYLRA